MDTLKNNVDTILHKLIIEQNIYDTILTEQHETYEFLMYWFLGIITLVLAVSFFLNFYYFDKKIESAILEGMASTQKKLEQEVQKKSDSSKEELKKMIEEIEVVVLENSFHAQASVFHIQANNNLSNNLYSRAFWDFMEAGIYYSRSSDKTNLLRVLNMSEKCLLKLTKKDIEALTKIENFDLLETINKIEKANEKGELSDAIDGIKKGYISAKSNI